MSEFKVGDKVRHYYDWNPANHGTLLTVEDGEGEVQWKKYKGRVDFEEIVLASAEADAALAKEVQDKLDEAKNAFEKAFEAFNAAQELGRKSLYSMNKANLIDLGPLESVIESGGWSASSLYC